MDCRVVVEGAVPVYDVETPEEAVRIAISKTGGMLNPDLSYVEIEPADRTAPDGSERPAAFVAADEALVALAFELNVFNVETEEHAERIARSELGGALEDIPLKVQSVEPDGDEVDSEIPDSDEVDNEMTDGDVPDDEVEHHDVSDDVASDNNVDNEVDDGDVPDTEDDVESAETPTAEVGEDDDDPR